MRFNYRLSCYAGFLLPFVLLFISFALRCTSTRLNSKRVLPVKTERLALKLVISSKRSFKRVAIFAYTPRFAMNAIIGRIFSRTNDCVVDSTCAKKAMQTAWSRTANKSRGSLVEAEIISLLRSTRDLSERPQRRNDRRLKIRYRLLFILFVTSLCMNYRFLASFDEKGGALDDLDMISFEPVRSRMHNEKRMRPMD